PRSMPAPAVTSNAGSRPDARAGRDRTRSTACHDTRGEGKAERSRRVGVRMWLCHVVPLCPRQGAVESRRFLHMGHEVTQSVPGKTLAVLTLMLASLATSLATLASMLAVPTFMLAMLAFSLGVTQGLR